jgi:hypothetical protein
MAPGPAFQHVPRVIFDNAYTEKIHDTDNTEEGNNNKNEGSSSEVEGQVRVFGVNTPYVLGKSKGKADFKVLHTSPKLPNGW